MDTQGVLVDGGAPALTEVKPALYRGLESPGYPGTQLSAPHTTSLGCPLLCSRYRTKHSFSMMPSQPRGPEAAALASLCNILNAPSLRTAAGQQKLPSGVESGSGCPSPRCCVWIPLPPTPSAAHTLPATFGAKDTGICYDFCIRQSGTLPASGSLVAHFLLILPTPPKSSQCRRDHA